MRETLRPHCERECMTLAAAMQKGSSKGSSSSAELVRCKMRHCTTAVSLCSRQRLKWGRACNLLAQL